MRIIRTTATARAGLVGNPSDGYHGRTISVPVGNFRATCVLYDWPDVEIVPASADASRFNSISALAEDVQLHGYYGGIRLVKATIKRFHDYCRDSGIALDDHRTFSVRYETTVPQQVGLAGSSAIITATLRALCKFFAVEVPLHLQPALILSVETRELGIAAGLQDRVVQAFAAPVFMDFSPENLKREGDLEYYHYAPMAASLFPPLYVAYRTDLSEPTERAHGDVRDRYYRGDPKVVEVMGRLARVTSRVRDLLDAGKGELIGPHLDENFDLRCEIYNVSEGNRLLVSTARKLGCSAKLAGSGGAIVGTYPDEATFARLVEAMAELNCRVIKPEIGGTATGSEEPVG